jgi:hypothetical protein
MRARSLAEMTATLFIACRNAFHAFLITRAALSQHAGKVDARV